MERRVVSGLRYKSCLPGMISEEVDEPEEVFRVPAVWCPKPAPKSTGVNLKGPEANLRLTRLTRNVLGASLWICHIDLEHVNRPNLETSPSLCSKYTSQSNHTALIESHVAIGPYFS